MALTIFQIEQQRLRDHAVKTMWCNPFIDRQAHLQLNKISHSGGTIGHVKYQWRAITLPVDGVWFHVYAIGQNSPLRLNVSPEVNVWMSLAESCEHNRMQADLYTDSGRVLMRSEAYIQVSVDRNILIAVPVQQTGINLDNEALYFRTYSNHWIDNTDTVPVDERILIEGRHVANAADILLLNQRLNSLNNLGVGRAIAVVNGFYTNRLLSAEVPVGSAVELFYDASIKSTHDFRLSDLNSFYSELDSTQKYLIHVPNAPKSVDYFDDIDFWLVHINPSTGKEMGIFIAKNHISTVRQVTHQDYALSVDRITSLLDSVPQWDGSDDVHVRLHIKESGYDRPWPNENSRIKELYKLTDAQIVRAMIGIDSTIPEWTASVLESANYPKLMGADYSELTIPLITEAYGYNALTVAFGESPIFPNEEGEYVLPFGAQWLSTVYEYDNAGILLGWRTHAEGEQYFPANPACRMIEVVLGTGGMDSGITIGNTPVTLEPTSQYRFYVSPKTLQGNPTNEWVDVTGDVTKYRITNGVVTWLIPNATFIGAVKGNLHFLSYDTTISDFDGLHHLTINHLVEDEGNVMHIPPGRIDVFMNGQGLTENIDYFVNYPEIMVVSKRFIRRNLPSQHFTVRCTGFCESDLSRIVGDQRGFVIDGVISVDPVYHLRDDRVVRCIVDGKTYDRSELQFDEDARQITIPTSLNGKVYCVENVLVPIRAIEEYRTDMLMNESRRLDTVVGNYMAEKLPLPTPPVVTPVLDYYNLYSPFMAKIIFDLVSEYLVPLEEDASDGDIAEHIAAYIPLLTYEPLKRPETESEYIKVHPHSYDVTVAVSASMLAFMNRINDIYLEGKLNFSPFITIT